MQKQTIPINISTKNKPIKMFIVISSLIMFALLFIIVSLIRLVPFEITLPINLLLQTQILTWFTPHITLASAST